MTASALRREEARPAGEEAEGAVARELELLFASDSDEGETKHVLGFTHRRLGWAGIVGYQPGLGYRCAMSATEPPVACDLGKLDDGERRRERELLAWFRAALVSAWREEGTVRYALPADARTLAAVGELLAYERLCCPFLAFRLEVDGEQRARLTIGGSDAALDLVLAEFGGGS